MPNHGKCEWTVHTSLLLMSKNSIKNVLENLFLLIGRGKTQNRAKTHRPSMSAFSAIFVLKENGTQSHSAKFLNWGDHVNSVPDLAASPPWLYLFIDVSMFLFCFCSPLSKPSWLRRLWRCNWVALPGYPRVPSWLFGYPKKKRKP